MKKITMFVMNSCPYCIRAKQRVEKVLSAHPEFRAVPFEIIDERQQSDLARKYDYYYVPTFYLDKEKVYEENVLHMEIGDIFRDALKG